MRWKLALAVVLIVSCDPSSAAPPASSNPRPMATAGGCGFTQVVSGAIPRWLDEAGAHNNPTSVPYVVATPAIAAGFLFALPLRSGQPNNPANKILWVVGKPRNGSLLDITAHPMAAASPVVDMSFAPNASPGEIYPSIDDVPLPGCWQFDLRWDANLAEVDLQYI